MITAKCDALQERMIKAGFTGAGLAKATGISQGYVSQMMNSKRSILPTTAKKIIEALRCDFDDIFIITKAGNR